MIHGKPKIGRRAYVINRLENIPTIKNGIITKVEKRDSGYQKLITIRGVGSYYSSGYVYEVFTSKREVMKFLKTRLRANIRNHCSRIRDFNKCIDRIQSDLDKCREKLKKIK